MLEQVQEATSCQIRGELGTTDFEALVELVTARLDAAGLEWEREDLTRDE